MPRCADLDAVWARGKKLTEQRYQDGRLIGDSAFVDGHLAQVRELDAAGAPTRVTEYDETGYAFGRKVRRDGGLVDDPDH